MAGSFNFYRAGEQQHDASSPHGYAGYGVASTPPHPSGPLWIHPVAGFPERSSKRMITSQYMFVSPPEQKLGMVVREFLPAAFVVAARFFRTDIREEGVHSDETLIE